MRRRRYVRWGSLAFAGGTVALLVWQLAATFAAQRESSLDPDDLVAMPEKVVQWIQNFRRIDVKDGRRAWEVEAEEARFLDSAGEVLVRKPKTAVYLEDGQTVTVTGGEGVLTFDGRELREVLLRNDVTVRLRDFTLTADEAVYDRDLQRIIANGRVRIEGGQIELEGTNMVVFVRDSKVEFLEDVTATLFPDRDAAEIPS